MNRYIVLKHFIHYYAYFTHINFICFIVSQLASVKHIKVFSPLIKLKFEETFLFFYFKQPWSQKLWKNHVLKVSAVIKKFFNMTGIILQNLCNVFEI